MLVSAVQQGESTIYIHVHVYAKSLQLCPTLCDPMDCGPPGSSINGILQARILEWVALPSPEDLPDPGTEPVSVSCDGGWVLYHQHHVGSP